ncbi:MAG: hypothetical protein WCY54_10935, partial [Syntrophales bacterium]
TPYSLLLTPYSLLLTPSRRLFQQYPFHVPFLTSVPGAKPLKVVSDVLQKDVLASFRHSVLDTESSVVRLFWIPASAGMTFFGPFKNSSFLVHGDKG